ncbi:MAG: 16S rRNA (cytidine(1402)-2'-O)-methyltransferase [Chloroflexi bacterium]|nr:16S rRNA (cytidine(1402)-2'-O)-methyltransferase [Chloroflexota bacterium]
MGTLFIVPTPIGNLEDITLRALRVLREAALIAAEDTRTSRVLTRHFDINTPMTSYHEHNKLSKLDEIFAALETADVALISDAGTPGISDPGYELIAAALARGYEVVPLPGACAITTALVGSGLAADSFRYVGFLPRKTAALRARLKDLRAGRETIVAYESPYRLADSLALIAEVMGGERRVCVARELSKKFEQFYRGSARELRDLFAADSPRGEVTLVIAGADPGETRWSEEQVRSALRRRLAAGEAH